MERVIVFVLIVSCEIVWVIFGWLLYVYFYFKSKKFNDIKKSIRENTKSCNELNEHIEELKNTYVEFARIDYGQADYIDRSRYNFKRPQLKRLREDKMVHNCSLSVLNSARNQPFKYVCKYFNIKPSEETLSEFEKVVNDFSAVEQGKNLLKNEREEIISNISDKIPTLIRVLAPKKLRRKLGFRDIDFSQVYFPKFGFQYISAGGNSFQSYDVVFDIENLDRFIRYLAELVKFRKSVAGQRALMTSTLREKIKARDNYTCKHCGLSTMQEPNLLLEIDHIMPLSRNGLTTEENLQTLCWRCNRSKGAKIIN